jgi:hypothetical protein
MLAAQAHGDEGREPANNGVLGLSVAVVLVFIG